MNETPPDYATVLKRGKRSSRQRYCIKLRVCLRKLCWDLRDMDIDFEGYIDTWYILCDVLLILLNLRIVSKVQAGLPIQITSQELIDFTAMTVAGMSTRHPVYSLLAGRLCVSDIHKRTGTSFADWIIINGRSAVFEPDIINIVAKNAYVLDTAIVHARDYTFTYPAIQTMMHSYLIRLRDGLIERPQFMYMRTALAIHGSNIGSALETYDALSKQLYTHASPTLFNAGTKTAYYASCFLTQPDPQCPRTLLRHVADTDGYWMADGGVGLSLGAVPCKRLDPVRQPGVMALMKVYDSHAGYCIASRKRRPSAATVYLPIWH
ncbi:ribonucleotide reductase R1 subunit [Earliella scabrosa]|nr:ribonucleotide reductase R1 subunit [Earliella scabrosa]